MGGMPTPEYRREIARLTKQARIQRLWRKHEANFTAMALHAFELLGHPDATEEDIQTAVDLARRTMDSHIKAVNEVRKQGVWAERLPQGFVDLTDVSKKESTK